MKIVIDETIQPPTKEEIGEMKERSANVEMDMARFKEDMLRMKTAVFPSHVVERLKEMGLTPDDIIAALLKKAGASQ